MASTGGDAPDLDRLLGLIGELAGQAVLMVGDLVADRFITGTPKRISREAPVLILGYESEHLVPGGGANAVANVAALGGRPLPVGVVGDDDAGARLIEQLDSRGIEASGIARKTGYRTPTKTRILAGFPHASKQQVVRFDIEDRLALDEADRRRIEEGIRALRGRARVAVISDYGFGCVDPSLLPVLREAVGDDGVILCDSRHRLTAFRGLDGATPNEEEAEAILGHALGDGAEQIHDSGRELRESLDAPWVVVTRGSRGMCLSTDAMTVHIPVHGTDQVADVTGAGDTVIGTLALATAAGATPLEAALLADYAGGIVVMRMGTATANRAELEAAVRSDPVPREELVWVRS